MVKFIEDGGTDDGEDFGYEGDDSDDDDDEGWRWSFPSTVCGQWKHSHEETHSSNAATFPIAQYTLAEFYRTLNLWQKWAPWQEFTLPDVRLIL